MTETDNPLKALITLYGEAFAAWLLDRAVRHVRPLNVEFPARAAQSDLLFEVIDEEGTLIYLHIELQGRRSHEPMSLRMLDYLSRIARREFGTSITEADGPRLYSVVLYVGEGAGRNDEGVYEIQGVGSSPTLRWRYHPVRLWEMPAETLLQSGQPALMALIGQSKLRQPEQEVSAAIEQIRQEEKAERLLTSLVSLLSGEEIITMVEKMIEESDDLLLDTPYLRRMRRLGREEGLEEGLKEGQAEGLRGAILDGIVYRFNPPAADYRNVEKELQTITAYPTLQRIHAALFETADFPAFRRRVEEELA